MKKTLSGKKIFVALSVVMFLLLTTAPVAFASVSAVSITSVSATRATVGTSITVTASVTATASENGNIQIVLPDGVIPTDPSSGQYQGVSLSSTPTSKTFTIKATSPAESGASVEVTSGGVSDTTTITFVNPSTVTVSPNITSITKTGSGQTFGLAIDLSSNEATTTNYTLSLPSGYPNPSGDQTSNTIAVSGTTQLVWTITTGSSTGTISFDLGSSTGAATVAVTISPTSSSTSTTSSSSTGTTTTTTAVKETLKITSIQAGKSAEVLATKPSDLKIKSVEIFAKNTVSNVQVTVQESSSPAGAAAVITADKGSVLKYVEFSKVNLGDADIQKAVIKFQVENSWLTANKINSTTVALYRYSSSVWNKLNTTKTGSDSNNTYYSAESPGFSVFAIAGEKTSAAATPTVEEKPPIPPTPEKEAEKKPTAAPGMPSDVTIIVAIIAIIVLAAVAYFKRDKILSAIRR